EAVPAPALGAAGAAAGAVPADGARVVPAAAGVAALAPLPDVLEAGRDPDASRERASPTADAPAVDASLEASFLAVAAAASLASPASLDGAISPAGRSSTAGSGSGDTSGAITTGCGPRVGLPAWG